MEFPVTDPRCRRRYGTAGRGGRRRQALGGHFAVRVRTGPRLARDRRTAGVPMCHRSGCDGRSGGGHRGHGSVHRLHQDRTGHRCAGRRTIDSLRCRTRRQGPGHRPGRRRSFACRQRDRVGGTVQLGAGLHLRGAGVCRGTGIRPFCRTAHRARPVDQAGGRQWFVHNGCRRLGHQAAARNRQEPCPGCRDARGHDRDRRRDERRVLRAHNSSRRRSFHGVHARRDLWPDNPRDEGRR